MTATVPTAIEAEVVTAARATDGSPAAYDRIGLEYGLLWRDVLELVQKADRVDQARLARRAGTRDGRAVPAVHPTGSTPDCVGALKIPSAAVPSPEPQQPTVPLTKQCSGCGETKSKADFYSHPTTHDGLASQCAACNNRRQPTLSRVLRNRARNRAKEALVKAYPEEFERFLAAELVTATREHQAVAAAAEARGQHDAPVARLKPGKKREGESVTDRLDVARCRSCHTHHDAAHECPGCGETTPEQPLKARPHVVRAWALAHSISVPQRGPIPARVLEQYLEAHPAIDQEYAS